MQEILGLQSDPDKNSHLLRQYKRLFHPDFKGRFLQRIKIDCNSQEYATFNFNILFKNIEIYFNKSNKNENSEDQVWSIYEAWSFELRKAHGLADLTGLSFLLNSPSIFYEPLYCLGTFVFLHTLLAFEMSSGTPRSLAYLFDKNYKVHNFKVLLPFNALSMYLCRTKSVEINKSQLFANILFVMKSSCKSFPL